MSAPPYLPGREPPDGRPFARLLEPQVPAWATSKVNITPRDVIGAAILFAGGQHDLDAAVNALTKALDSLAGMAGTDSLAHAFNKSYEHAVAAAMTGFQTAISTFGGISLGLTQTANNHISADHASTRGGSKSPPELAKHANVIVSPVACAPASAIGTGSSALPGILAKYWPNGDPERLRSAAAAWDAAATSVRDIGGRLNVTINSLTTANDAADMAAIMHYWDTVHSPGNPRTITTGLHDLCAAISIACGDYAAKIEGARSKMKWALAGLGIGVTITMAVGVVATPVTVGGSDVVASAASAAEVGAALAPIAASAALAIAAATAGDLTLAVSNIQICNSSTATVRTIEARFNDEAGRAIENELRNGPPDTPTIPGHVAEPWHGGGYDASVAADKIASHNDPNGEDGIDPHEDRSIPGVSDADLSQYLENIMRGPGFRLRPTPRGAPRMAWWDQNTNTMIIRTGNGGTFVRSSWNAFVSQVRQP